jgi:hypothetical protein
MIAQMRAANAERFARRRAEFLAWRAAHPEEYALQVHSAAMVAPLPAPEPPPHRGLRPEPPRRRAVRAPDAPKRPAVTSTQRWDRMRRALELRAAGLTYRAIGEAMGSLQHPGPIGPERVRQIVGRGERILRHPSRAAQWAEYEATGTFTPWW